ncbi:hypothetical protein ACFWV1_12785 [Streptomyces sp. NPDC058700]|uniref:hypothetical protein n=1 Tax=Streptomyces sp. NPDC058700 TaxID=3346607 RepID=UPI003650353A
MTEPLPDRPVRPIVDLAAADASTLVEMGVLDPQPEPAPPAEPPLPGNGQEVANEALLMAAFADAGVPHTEADAAAVDRIATLDPQTVKAVAEWVKRGKKEK